MKSAFYLPTGHDAGHGMKYRLSAAIIAPHCTHIITRGAPHHPTIRKVPVTTLGHHCTHNMQSELGAAYLSRLGSQQVSMDGAAALGLHLEECARRASRG